MLASLAQEGELSSPGHSDEEEVQPKSAFISQPDDGTGLLHADIAARDAASAVQSSSSAADADARGQMSSEVLDSKSEQEAAPLAQALAALVADAQQAQQPGPMAQQAQQSSQMAQQAQRQPHEDAESSAAGADQNEDAESMSSQDSGDLLAEAAAAATAAGLSPRPQPHSDLADAQPQYAGNPVDQDAAASQETSAVPQWSRVKSRQAQHGPQQAKHAVLEDPTVQHAAQQGPKQAKHAMFADQEIEFESQQGMQKQRQSGSGDYIGPASSAPSWSGSAAGVGRFRDKQAINYVGKSARRPQVSNFPLHHIYTIEGYSHVLTLRVITLTPCT